MTVFRAGIIAIVIVAVTAAIETSFDGINILPSQQSGQQVLSSVWDRHVVFPIASRQTTSGQGCRIEDGPYCFSRPSENLHAEEQVEVNATVFGTSVLAYFEPTSMKFTKADDYLILRNILAGSLPDLTVVQLGFSINFQKEWKITTRQWDNVPASGYPIHLFQFQDDVNRATIDGNLLVRLHRMKGFGVVASDEVSITFRKPIMLDSFIYRIQESFIREQRHQSGNKLEFRLTTVGPEGEDDIKVNKILKHTQLWQKLEFPKELAPKISKIIITQGVEIDKIDFRMNFESEQFLVISDARDDAPQINQKLQLSPDLQAALQADDEDFLE